MDKIKRLKEEKNSAIAVMQDIRDSYDLSNLDSDTQEKWNKAKATVEQKNSAIANLQELENYEKGQAVRSKDADKTPSFNFLDALAYASNRDAVSAEKRDYFENLDKDAKKKASSEGVSLQGGRGLVLPTNALNGSFRNDLTVTTEGSDILFDENGGFINALQERMVLTQLGADMMTGLVGDVRFPRESNTLRGAWEGETDANTEKTPTYDNVTLSPNRYSFYVDVSNQALIQTSPSVEARVQRQIMDGVQRGIESAAISGSVGGPNGLLDIATLIPGSTTNSSGSLAFSDVVDLESQVGSSNALVGSLGYLGSSKVRGQAKQTAKDSGSGIFVWEGNEVNGYTALASNLSPDGANYSPLFFGNFEDMMIGMFGGMEILVDPYTQATNGITRYHINIYSDVAFAHNESFAYYQIANS